MCVCVFFSMHIGDVRDEIHRDWLPWMNSGVCTHVFTLAAATWWFRHAVSKSCLPFVSLSLSPHQLLTFATGTDQKRCFSISWVGWTSICQPVYQAADPFADDPRCCWSSTWGYNSHRLHDSQNLDLPFRPWMLGGVGGSMDLRSHIIHFNGIFNGIFHHKPSTAFGVPPWLWKPPKTSNVSARNQGLFADPYLHHHIFNLVPGAAEDSRMMRIETKVDAQGEAHEFAPCSKWWHVFLTFLGFPGHFWTCKWQFLTFGGSSGKQTWQWKIHHLWSFMDDFPISMTIYLGFFVAMFRLSSVWVSPLALGSVSGFGARHSSLRPEARRVGRGDAGCRRFRRELLDVAGTEKMPWCFSRMVHRYEQWIWMDLPSGELT